VIRKSVAGMHVGKLVKQFETGRKSTIEDSGKKTQPSLTVTPVRKTTSTKKMTPGKKLKLLEDLTTQTILSLLTGRKLLLLVMKRKIQQRKGKAGKLFQSH
jgi:hypothetical protein